MRARSFLHSKTLPFVAAMALASHAGAESVTSKVEQQAVPAPAAAPAAASTATVTTTPPIPNSAQNYLGDRLAWDTPIFVHAVSKGGGVDTTNGYCLPQNVRVVGLATSFTSSSVQAPGSATATTTNYLPATLNTQPLLFGILPAQTSAAVAEKQVPISATGKQTILYVDKTAEAQSVAQGNPCIALPTPTADIDEGTEFYVSESDLEGASLRTGWDFGTLAVPFKIQLSQAHAFTGSATIGGYLGYRMPFGDLGVRYTPIVFAGASNISTSATTGGTTTSQTVAGLSYGLGVIGTVKDSFQIGLIVGADHVDSAQPYKYNDKPWISFALGYSFSQ